MAYRQLPTVARRIGFEITDPPSDVEIQPHGASIRCRQRQSDGQPIGEIELEVFHAALVIDRDGILEEKVQAAIAQAAPPGARVLETVPIELPGASGFRADIELERTVATASNPRPPLPCIYVFAIAPHDLGVDGGLLITVRSASPDWPAAEQILGSLKILSRRNSSANDR